ncbi:MAG TPA: Rieske (2Fe-2S) protein [Terriglobales bacterium]|nr:Rieske (2Fe-2S) protein [Terriglobales bacterium]
MGFSGWMGGSLVYRNQIGVDHRTANAGKYIEREFSGWDKPVCDQAELGEGQSMLARIAGERVVVARCSEGLVAFSDRCTHKGGPLSDGAIIGCAVQCPWHGSQFDILTGRVVARPAKQKIKTYEVEIVDKEVFVRPRKSPSRKAA